MIVGFAQPRHRLGIGFLHDGDVAAGLALADLGLRLVAAQQRVDDFGDVLVNRQPIAIVDLDNDVEGRRRFALEHGLARAAPARFLVGERDGADAADQVGERRVHQEVLERLAVRRADQRHAALGDRARGGRFGLGADLVDDDDLGHVVFDRFDHHGVLQRRIGDLHAPREADAGMRNVAVAGDFVRGVDDDDALAIFGKHARALAQHRRLADARAAEQTDRLPAAQHVEQDVDRAVNRAPDAARKTDDLAGAVANRADAVQRLLDAGAIIGAERRDARADVRDVFVRTGTSVRYMKSCSKRASGGRPRSSTTSMISSRLGRRTSACRIGSGKMSRSWESSQLGEME